MSIYIPVRFVTQLKNGRCIYVDAKGNKWKDVSLKTSEVIDKSGRRGYIEFEPENNQTNGKIRIIA